jgi:methyl-accepting chemotaxis protein
MKLKLKLNLVLLFVVGISISSIILVSYRKSKEELTKSVLQDNRHLAEKTASDISKIVESEFVMLETMAKFPTITDPDIDMKTKWEQTNVVTANNPRYSGTGFFDTTGNGFNSGGKWVDMHTRDYLVASMAGKRGLMDPHTSSLGAFVATYAVPVKAPNGQQIAEISAVIAADDMAQSMQNIVVGKSSHPFIANTKTNKIVAHSDIEVMKAEKDIFEIAGEDFIKAGAEAAKGATGSIVYYDKAKRMKMAAAYCPIANTDWEVVLIAPYNDFFGGIKVLFQVMLSIAIIALFVAAVIGVGVVESVVRPLRKLSGAINAIASGEADLTKRLVSLSKDEIGDVVDGFNAFSEKLQTIISDVKKSKDDLVIAGEDMSASSEDTASAITEILANIDSIRSQIENQGASVNQTAGAVNEIAGNIESLEKMIGSQSDSVAEASSAVEEMIGNIGAVNSSVDKMASSFETLLESSKTGFAKQQDVNNRVKDIDEQSQMLQEANSAISAIASQTNLLAMNAAIEAAHAGEAGQGFAVVADEIRKLSETSNAQSKTIGEQLKVIKQSIDSVVKSSNEASATFSKVSDMLSHTDALVMQIKSAMREQNEGSSQITGALRKMNDSTLEVRSASAEMREGNKMILSEMHSLQNASLEIRQSMEEMGIGARKINETGAALGDISDKVEKSITQIGSQVDKFKV